MAVVCVDTRIGPKMKHFDKSVQITHGSSQLHAVVSQCLFISIFSFVVLFVKILVYLLYTLVSFELLPTLRRYKSDGGSQWQAVV